MGENVSFYTKYQSSDDIICCSIEGRVQTAQCDELSYVMYVFVAFSSLHVQFVSVIYSAISLVYFNMRRYQVFQKLKSLLWC